MSGFTPIRAAIVARLATVPDIGRVHDRERLFTDETSLRSVHGWPDTLPVPPIRGWFVSLVRFSGNAGRAGRGRRITTEWRIGGFLSLEDGAATENTMSALVEQIATAFDADPTLGGTVQRCAVGEGPDVLAGIQCEDIAPVRLVDTILCHRALLTLPTQHFG